MPGASGRAAIGIAIDNRNRLFVAGGPTGRAFVYNARTSRITDSRFAVPTTIDDHGRRLYAVNAHFNATNPSMTDYQVVQVRKPRGG